MKNKSLYSYLYILLFSVASYNLNGQDYIFRKAFIKANSHWTFGYGAGINFNTNPPTAMPTAHMFSSGAAVSDTATGALLFYAAGEAGIWNRNHQLMPNGSGLSASSAFDGSCCIVPVLDSPGKFYVFTLNGYPGNYWGLRYSVVDMNLDGGLGDIVAGRKDSLMSPHNILGETTVPFGQMMIAIPGDNCDIWLLLHPYGQEPFYAYHITKQGIDLNPVISSNTGPGPQVLGGDAWSTGGLAVSPNRKMIAVSSAGHIGCVVLGYVPTYGGSWVAQFDPATGIVSNGIKLDDRIMANSLCFSSNSSKLYVLGEYIEDTTAIGFSIPDSALTEQLTQYDVSNFNQTDILNSATVIAKAPVYSSMFSRIGGSGQTLRRRPDNPDMILLANSFFSINNANMPGLACNFVEDTFIKLVYDPVLMPNFAGSSQTCLGNDVVYPLPPDTSFTKVLDTAVCFKESVLLQARESFSSYHWQDGNINSSRIINDTGIYWVFCKDDCHSRADTFVVRLKADVAVSLGNDTIVCGRPPLLLHASGPEAGTSFLWSDGSADSIYSVDTNGFYSVISSKSGCSDSDHISVNFRDLTQHLGENQFPCRGDSIYLYLEANVTSNATILWSTGNTGSSITVHDTGIYWVSVREAPCEGSDTITVDHQLCECTFGMPTAFSPNGDSKNDIFRPIIEAECLIRQYSLNIYNRWGQLIFCSYNVSNGWDGTYAGNTADIGSYMYEIKLSSGTKGKEYCKKGDVLLIR